MDADETVGLLAQGVRTETINPPGNEERMAALLARCLERKGLTVECNRCPQAAPTFWRASWGPAAVRHSC
jgi:hypothetical protein